MHSMVQSVGADHRRADVFVPDTFLNHSNIVANVFPIDIYTFLWFLNQIFQRKRLSFLCPRCPRCYAGGGILCFQPVGMRVILRQGVEKAFNLDSPGADALFQKAVELDPEDPTGYCPLISMCLNSEKAPARALPLARELWMRLSSPCLFPGPSCRPPLHDSRSGC